MLKTSFEVPKTEENEDDCKTSDNQKHDFISSCIKKGKMPESGQATILGVNNTIVP